MTYAEEATIQSTKQATSPNSEPKKTPLITPIMSRYTSDTIYHAGSEGCADASGHQDIIYKRLVDI
jgi:hypothetical protein